ncbi:hypothetical protein NST07_10555 [Paenibacillus sp. FSL L8-0340]|uniref:hypothetical protein n=1 Tax=Paenibacillus sp. FSL L8-0340 TaxID=2954685 RepID=UPI003158564B
MKKQSMRMQTCVWPIVRAVDDQLKENVLLLINLALRKPSCAGILPGWGYTSWNWRPSPIRICWTSSREFVRFSIARWNVRT